MKKILPFFLVTLLFVYCSGYNVRTEISDSKSLKNFKKSGIIYRLNQGHMVSLEEMIGNLEYWLASYENKNELVLIKDISEDITSTGSDIHSFNQLSTKNKFLHYKSVGVITMYLRKYEESFKRLIEEHGLDSLLIYEVDGGFSSTMQFIDFSTVVLIVDSSLKITYLDHQNVMFDIDEWDPDVIRKHLTDKINDRLLRLLFDLNYLEEK